MGLVNEQIELLVIGGQGFYLETTATMNASTQADKSSCKYICLNALCCTPCCTYCSEERDPTTGEPKGCVGRDRPACFTNFHKMYCRKSFCPAPCPCAGEYSAYIDDHLEWRSGSEYVKEMLLTAPSGSAAKRISKFALEGDDEAEGDAEAEGGSEAEIELSDVVVVADTEAQQPGDTASTMNPVAMAQDEGQVGGGTEAVPAPCSSCGALSTGTPFCSSCGAQA
jgi:hypothetical protein